MLLVHSELGRLEAEGRSEIKAIHNRPEDAQNPVQRRS